MYIDARVWLRSVLLVLPIIRGVESQDSHGPLSTPQIEQNFTLIQVNFTPGVDTSKAVPLPRDIAALSIEFCYIIDYLGDVSSPNNLSYNLLNNIQDILGAPPVIRVGGDTGDVARYHPHNNQTITNVFVPNDFEAVNVSFNDGLFQVMNENVPENQTYIFTLNLGQDNVQYPLAEVQGAEAHLNASRLYAYELGNEPDLYVSNGRRSEPWNVQIYAQQQVDWLTQIKQEIKNNSHGFQLGAIVGEPTQIGNFSLAEINRLGVPKLVGNVKSESEHTYPYSNCPGVAPPVSLPSLMNHLNTIEYFSQWAPEIAAANSVGASFVMGETGSVSCHGAPNISNTLGAALWEIDYMLHGATLGMRRIHFHNGSPFWYSMWQPVAVNGTAPRVWPTYASLIFVAGTLSGSTNPTLFELSALESETLALYALYEGDYLYKVLAINLEFYSAANASADVARPQLQLNMTAVLGEQVRAFRITAPSSEETDMEKVTVIGQNYASGTASGTADIEYYMDGVVGIAASEALIIERSPNATVQQQR
ncbi:MAG: hypothetical protein M1821_006931 [Bathelium mastoideum]|nr:MAG: hypothetical protein M1821_006931 [Bathelium mastoideum]